MLVIAGFNVDLNKDEAKAMFKEAIKEWLRECAAEFGIWTARIILVLILAALTYFVLTMNGWRRG